MRGRRALSAVRVSAFAKINLALRVLGARPDGYHELQTRFQSIELHDSLTFVETRDPFRIECDDPACPTDRTNLVWRAAELLWSTGGRHGAPRGILVNIVKQIPMQAGLGGASSDAAAALTALSLLWRVRLNRDRLRVLAAELGADVPFFLTAGTAVGLDRGDRLIPESDFPTHWLAIVIPPFGVSTRDAYKWWDHESKAASNRPVSSDSGRSGLPPGNDLERVVAARHPEIARLVQGLKSSNAAHAAMSGSGSAVFGLFKNRSAAERAATALAAGNRQIIVTRTLDRATCRRRQAVRRVTGGRLAGN